MTHNVLYDAQRKGRPQGSYFNLEATATISCATEKKAVLWRNHCATWSPILGRGIKRWGFSIGREVDMRINAIDIQNFRKLKSIRLAFNKETTLFVGANNSGKTSAMLALGHFLIDPSRFNTNDFTLSNWPTINKIGDGVLRKEKHEGTSFALQNWVAALPTLDIWLEVESNEIHYVRKILPTLDWNGGLLGVRLRYEPDDLENLYKEFIAASKFSAETKKARADKVKDAPPLAITLWPETLRAFLDRKLGTHFALRVYLLDPTAKDFKEGDVLRPQPLPAETEPIDGNPLKSLIRVNEIEAQRGFGRSSGKEIDSEEETRSFSEGQRLSEQLRSYYNRHLDPSDKPEPADLDALEAIETSQNKFDERLESGFSDALKELESLNYPGVTDPKLKIATRVRPVEGLNHSGAVQFEVVPEDGKEVLVPMRLPEAYNGLGYQNLISMVFKLMSFRDAWMRVGKAGAISSEDDPEKILIPPLHLVLIEEPEAHLHAQVQQVFLRQAYAVLRKHPDLGEKPSLQTQLVVSTHSSHVAHEVQFSSLRYFRRLPPTHGCCVPTSVVVNLSEVFGVDDETEKFVTRYLRATHCDLFFADAAILIEGPAERMLVPHFIRTNFKDLNRCFVTLLEINGSHAHRLRPLVEHLGLTTLVIADIDPCEATGHHKAVPAKKGAALLTRNATLKAWHPKKELLDELLDLANDEKVKKYFQPLFSIRVAYQSPIKVSFNDKEETALAATFEDALVFENLDYFKSIIGEGMAAQFKTAITSSATATALAQALFDILKEGDKAEFALELLISEKQKLTDGREVEASAPVEKLKPPAYIYDGLKWLESQFAIKKTQVLAAVAAAETTTAK
jgi:predicted ATP-dependent endonuclease of OLD family